MQGTAAGSALIKTDWEFGSDKKSLLRSIGKGIPGTTMIGWKGVLSAKQLELLTDYILQAQKTPAKTGKAE
jgi:hypothetical protein